MHHDVDVDAMSVVTHTHTHSTTAMFTTWVTCEHD